MAAQRFGLTGYEKNVLSSMTFSCYVSSPFQLLTGISLDAEHEPLGETGFRAAGREVDCASSQHAVDGVEEYGECDGDEVEKLWLGRHGDHNQVDDAEGGEPGCCSVDLIRAVSMRHGATETEQCQADEGLEHPGAEEDRIEELMKIGGDHEEDGGESEHDEARYRRQLADVQHREDLWHEADTCSDEGETAGRYVGVVDGADKR